jgi:transposase InsO family protein
MPSVPPTILDRQLVAERLNQKWIADFTYICSWLYILAVIGLFSPG